MPVKTSHEETLRRSAEAARQAGERLAAISPEVRARTEALVASFNSKLVRLFCGTEDMAKSKGHQPCEVVSVEDLRKFRKAHPATHQWVEFERQVLERET